MRIEFQRAGGFHPPAMKRSFAVNTEELPADEASRILALVHDSGAFEISQPAAETGPRPDMFGYKLTLIENDRQHTLHFSETELPEKLRPLVSWLMKQAGPGK